MKASCGYNVFWTIAKLGFRNQAEPEYSKIFLQNFHIKCIIHFAGTSLIFVLSSIYLHEDAMCTGKRYTDVAPKLCIFEIFFVKFAKCFWVTINRPESFFMTHNNELELLFFKKISTIQICFYCQNLNKSILSIAGLNSSLVYNSIQKPS